MSVIPEEAWIDEAWHDQFHDQALEYLEAFREDIIEGFIADRARDYYRLHPDLAEAAEFALKDARLLLDINHRASLVFSRAATEIALRDVILKPIAFGMVNDDKSGALMVELALDNQRFSKLLLAILDDYGIQLRTFTREGSSVNLWKEIDDMKKVRNRIIHTGGGASREQAETSIQIAELVLGEMYDYMREQIMNP